MPPTTESVIVVTEYVCPICHTGYAHREHADTCLVRGRPPLMPEFVGVIFGDNRPGAFYEGMVFALPPEYATDKYHEGHNLRSSYWACRDAKGRFRPGDSLGEEHCGGNFLKMRDLDSTHVDQSMPAFKRMVAYLRSQGIPPKLRIEGVITEIPEEEPQA